MRNIRLQELHAIHAGHRGAFMLATGAGLGALGGGLLGLLGSKNQPNFNILHALYPSMPPYGFQVLLGAVLGVGLGAVAFLLESCTNKMEYHSRFGQSFTT